MVQGGHVRVTCVGAHPLYDGTLAVRFALEGAPASGLEVRAAAWTRRPRRCVASVFAPSPEGGAAFSVRMPEGSRALFLSLSWPGVARRRLVIRADAWRPRLESWLGERTNAQDDPAHDAWMRARRSSPAELDRQRAEVATWEDAPLVSIVTPLFRTPEPFLRACLASLLCQTYANFELVLVNASGPCPSVDAVLAECHDERVRVLEVENAGIAANTNVGIAAARGAYVGFVDHDDFVEPDALYWYVRAIRERPETDLLFCDEDLYGGDPGEERYYGVRFKPGWDPDLLMTHNYVCHLLMVSRRALELTERSGDDVTGAQDYDLTFKVAEVARHVCHVPRVLYHWREHPGSTAVNRDSKPYALEAGRLSVERHLRREGVAASVSEGAFPFSYRVRYVAGEHASVSVIAAGGAGYAERVARSLSDCPLPVDVVPVPAGALGRPDELSAAALNARGEYVMLLDETCVPPDSGLVVEQASILARADVGCVGPLVLDADDVVQACGLIARPDGSFAHAERGLARRDVGYMTLLVHAHGVCALPAAGLMLRRADLKALGGLRPQCGRLAPQDLCLRLGERGLRCVVQPYVPLTTSAGVLAGVDDATASECAELLALHPALGAADPCLSPRLSRAGGLYQLPREEGRP